MKKTSWSVTEAKSKAPNEELFLNDSRVKGFKVRYIPNLLNQEEIKSLQKRMKVVKKNAYFHDFFDSLSCRYFYQNDFEFMNFSKTLEERISKELGYKVISSDVHCLMYINGGHFPPHVDTGEKPTISVLVPIEYKQAWSMYIDDKEYIPEIGGGLFYIGIKNVHWRNLIQTDNFSNHLIFVFDYAD